MEMDVSKLPAPRRAGVAMLSSMPKGGVCAEVGVFQGGFSRLIWEVVRPDELYLIDPWQWRAQWVGNHTEGELEALGKGESTSEGQAYFEAVCKKFAHIPQIKVQRLASVDASKSFPDKQFDWVFIDGDHRYQPAAEDLRHWWPKVKSGGFLCGDDYIIGGGPPHDNYSTLANGVYFAVEEFLTEHHLRMETFPIDGAARAFFKIKKV